MIKKAFDIKFITILKNKQKSKKEPTTISASH